ncbi:MAG: PAS domain-containing protein [Gammaproteobacteria bacterium]|nr:PAS domain-containing protein [Gammaproteobacteria bacterium]
MTTNTVEIGADPRAELQVAFGHFGDASRRLSGAFDSLRDRVAALGEELADARRGNARLNAHLGALLRALPGGVLVLDRHGRIREFNPAALDWLGEPLVGESLAAVLERVRVAPAGAGEAIALAGGRTVSLSRRALEDGGEVVLIADVTQAQQVQAVIARQQRLLTLGEMAAGLAHQIRTPLAAAMLYASQMTIPGRSAADLARCAEKTGASLKQLDRLVSEMLAFAHGGAERELVSLDALLEQVAYWLRPVMRAGTQLTIRTEAPKLGVRVNASSLASAVLNLAINALQASAGPLCVELIARRGAPGRAEILVRDDGPGIDSALRERIFEPFFTTRTRGNGLGLSIVKSVVEAHGGQVRLAETPVGATFVIDLPAEERR